MRKIIIVGGGGFIGGHLIERLIERTDVECVTVFDNCSSGRMHLPDTPRVRFYLGDAVRVEELVYAMAGADTVFHLAANPDIARAVTEPSIDFTQGTLLTHNVIEAARVCGVKQIFYTSGSGVYGENGDTLYEDYGPMNPISTYGASKLASEAMLSAYAHMFGLTARAFRFANVVGPRQTHGVGYDFLRRLKADRTRLKILGDGSQTKSYVYISDILDAVMLVAGKADPAVPFDVFNVATHDTLTVSQIAEMAVLASGIPPGFTHFEYGKEDRGWKGDVPKIRLHTGKIQALGWHCNHTAKDAMWLALMTMAEEIA